MPVDGAGRGRVGGSGRAATFTVNTGADLIDASPGDGTCATAMANCSLRAAVQEANALAGPDVILLPKRVYNLSIPPAPMDSSGANGDLDLTEDVEIHLR